MQIRVDLCFLGVANMIFYAMPKSFYVLGAIRIFYILTPTAFRKIGHSSSFLSFIAQSLQFPWASDDSSTQ